MSRSPIVYFVLALDVDLVKIGHSACCEKRLREISLWSPVELTLLKTFLGDVWTERHLHDKYKHLRIRGEWFKYAGEIETALASGEIERFCKDRETKAMQRLAKVRSRTERQSKLNAWVIGRRILEERQKRGITSRVLADVIGVSGGTQVERETGRRQITVAMVEQYATALGCKPSDLMPD